MAQRVVVELTDDVDGSIASETVQFGLDGATYEIDLSEQNAEKLRDFLSPYVGSARKMSGARASGSRRGRRAASASDGAAQASNQEIRSWAESQGITVSKRGRIPADVVAKFQEAQAQ